MKYKNPQINSSYRENDLGETLYDAVMKAKPKKVIEFGTLHGYSTVAIAMALHELGEGHITSYDLWDTYQYKHGSKANVQEMIDQLGLSGFVTLAQGDFKGWIPEPFDLMHVDISNDGKTIFDLREKTKNIDGIVLFEGGSLERDKVGWMTKYNKPPMGSCGVRYEVINSKFPSISKLV